MNGVPPVLRDAAMAVMNGTPFDDIAEDLAENENVPFEAAFEALNAALNELWCGHEIPDDSVDFPQSLFCGFPHGHAGEHGNWQH